MLLLAAAVSLVLAAPPVTGASTTAPVPSVLQVTPEKMRQDADEGTAEMRASLKRVLQMLEKARAARDIVLLNCLNEKLTQLKALVRVGEQSSVNLQEFLAKDQIEGATHERRKIGLAREKVKSITSEAETCLTESGAAGGRTIVTVEKPEFFGDPTHLDTPDPDVDDDTLPSASPYN